MAVWPTHCAAPPNTRPVAIVFISPVSRDPSGSPSFPARNLGTPTRQFFGNTQVSSARFGPTIRFGVFAARAAGLREQLLHRLVFRFLAFLVPIGAYQRTDRNSPR